MRKNNFIRGSQVTVHFLRMLIQSIRVFMLWSAIAFGVVFVGTIGLKLKGYHYQNILPYIDATISNKIGLKTSKVTFYNAHGRVLEFSAGDYHNRNAIRKVVRDFKNAFSSALLNGLLVLPVFLSFVIFYFWYQGRQMVAPTQKKGKNLVSSKQLAYQVTKYNKSQKHFYPYRIASIPYPKGAEQEHTLICGTTGTGKTALIADIIKQIKENGDKAFIYDKSGEFTASFYKEGEDTLLNPFDERSASWEIFSEVSRAEHFDSIAKTLISSDESGNDPYWVNSARTVFAEICAKLWKENKNVTNQELYNIFLNQDLDQIIELIKGTAAQLLINEKNTKPAASILGMLPNNLKILKDFDNTNKKFSIKEWITDEDDRSSVFVTTQSDMHASLAPIISTWFEIAVLNILSLQKSRTRKIFLIGDELQSLKKLASLTGGISEVRKYGGCFIIGVQSYSQLESAYGTNDAITINSNCKTKVLLNAEDSRTAKWASAQIGNGDFEETREGLTYSATDYRDAVNATTQHVVRPIVSDSEFSTLEKQMAYISFSGSFPVALAKFKYVAYEQIAKSFIPKLVQKTKPEETDEKLDNEDSSNSVVIEKTSNDNQSVEPKNIITFNSDINNVDENEVLEKKVMNFE